MKNIFSERLKNARLSSGLSMDKLVENMEFKVSKNAIAKYERGEIQPTGTVVIALAKALNTTVDYFFRPFSTTISVGDFRKKSKLPVKEESKIRGMITSKIERYMEIEHLIAVDDSFFNPLEGIITSNGDDAETAAEKLLVAWGLGFNGISNVYEILESNGVKVIEIDGHDDFDGFSTTANGNIPVMVIKSGITTERKRLTALHELAHLMLTFNKNLTEREKERLCFRFAGALLLPRKTFYRETGRYRHHFHFQELGLIKNKYGISAAAIIVRAYNLEVINDSVYTQLNKIISKNREEKGIGNYRGEERTTRFMQLIFKALSEEIISEHKAEELAEMKINEFLTQTIPDEVYN